MNKSIRLILEESEKTLEQQIKAIREQLSPLEAELADIKRARAALPNNAPLDAWGKQQSFFKNVESKRPKIKKLILQALNESFPNGATSRELLHFLNSIWNLGIPRESFSPQLSRLKMDQLVLKEGKLWRLSAKTRVKEIMNLSE